MQINLNHDSPIQIVLWHALGNQQKTLLCGVDNSAKMRSLYIIVFTTLLCGCIETQSSKGYRAEIPKSFTIPNNNIEIDSNTVFSVFGNPLPKREFNGRDKKDREDFLKKSLENFKKTPDNLESIIWYGRSMAYNGLYFEAIKIFSVGLEKFPTSYELLRHRGERYITIRQFDLAVEDLERAAFYSRPAKNELEKDGFSGNHEKSLSNAKFNIYFYLGTSHYLKGDYDKAISSFKKCLTFADNKDLLVKITDWFYLTYRKLGNEKAAQTLLLAIDKKTRVKQNVDYLNRLLVYRGNYKADRVLTYAENDDKSLTPILAYGIGNFFLFGGKVEKATQVFELILLNKAWDTLEYIATEVDLKNMQHL